MNINMSCLYPLVASFKIRVQVKEFSCVILWKKQPAYKPKADVMHQLKNCFQESSTKLLWPWLVLALSLNTNNRAKKLGMHAGTEKPKGVKFIYCPTTPAMLICSGTVYVS